MAARLPPRWFIRLAWVTHRRVYGVTGGRLGLWRPKKGWGTMRLTTVGRRSSQRRAARRSRPTAVVVLEPRAHA